MSESVVLETSLGDIQLELYWDHAPRVWPLALYGLYAHFRSPAETLRTLRKGDTTTALSFIV